MTQSPVESPQIQIPRSHSLRWLFSRSQQGPTILISGKLSQMMLRPLELRASTLIFCPKRPDWLCPEMDGRRSPTLYSQTAARLLRKAFGDVYDQF